MALSFVLIAGSLLGYGARVSGGHVVAARINVTALGARMLLTVLATSFCIGGGVLHEAREAYKG
jgi:hypothetical protein